MKRILVLVVFCGFLCKQIAAQQMTLNTTSLNSNNGFSQNSIQCIFKDSYGFMWFGTQDGLNKYDGLKFTVYRNIKKDPHTLPANLVNAICEDRHKNLWVATRVGGLSRFDRLHDCFITYKNVPDDASSISSDLPGVLLSDSRGRFWVGTGNGLNLYHEKTNRFERFFHSDNDPASLSSSYIVSMFEDDSHNLWIGTNKGLDLYNPQKRNFIHFKAEKVNPFGENNDINAITEDAHANIWLGTGAGLFLVDRQKHVYRQYAIEADKNLAGNINSVFCLAKTRGNRFWIGSNTTLQLFDADAKRIIPLSTKTNGEDLMPSDGINSLLEDNNGILWIGTTTEGIVKYDRNLTIFPSFDAAQTKSPSAQNIIRGISEDKAGNLYLATDLGVRYFDRVHNRYKNYVHNGKQANSLASNYVLTVIASRKTNKIWIGTYSSGLECFDPASGIFRHFTRGNDAKHLNGGGIYALMEDSKGNIWLAPEYGGVYEYIPSQNKFIHFTHNDKTPNSLGDNTAQAFFEDHAGNIWIGGYSNGISIYNPEKKTFRQLNVRNSGLSNNVISAFYEDKKGNMWVGTMEGGLNCYVERTHQFRALSFKSGVIDNTINYISGDDRGYLWISTIQGILRFDPRTNHFKRYTYNNGLKSLEFNLGAGTTLRNGQIALGSINGFNIVTPDSLSFNNNKPAVALTGFELFDKPVSITEQNSPLKTSIQMTQQIKLDYGQSIFSITYAALDFSLPENTVYAYKLDGFDQEWRYVGNQRKATYTNLNPGTYLFRVKAANSDGIWGSSEKTLSIIIVPPFWMTWWFRSIEMLAIVGMCYLLYQYRVSFFTRQKLELEKQVRKRTLQIENQAAQLQELNSELNTQKEEMMMQSADLRQKTVSLQLLNHELTEQKATEQKARLAAESLKKEAEKANLAKSTFLATMSHEIRTPMNGVLGMAALLCETELNSEQREYTDAIVNSGNSLLLVINDILDFSKIESGQLILDPHKFNVRNCVKEVLELFSFKALESGIDLFSQVDHDVPQVLVADGLRLRQILMNLVGNAVKFTHKGEVAVSVKFANPYGGPKELLFEVRDTGIGIPPEKLGNLFQAFNQVDSSVTRKYGGTGLGLVICERLAKLMGGQIEVTSTYQECSCFRFSIKCELPKEAISVAAKKDELQTNVHLSVLTNSFSAQFPLRILVAEDNAINQKLILRILQKLGYQADLANDGQEALDLLGNRPYDLVLMDVQMPNLDGLEATRIIRSRYDANPIVYALTANAFSEDKENCMAAGMNGYMSKPIAIEILKDHLIQIYKSSGHENAALKDHSNNSD